VGGCLVRPKSGRINFQERQQLATKKGTWGGAQETSGERSDSPSNERTQEEKHPAERVVMETPKNAR